MPAPTDALSWRRAHTFRCSSRYSPTRGHGARAVDRDRREVTALRTFAHPTELALSVDAWARRHDEAFVWSGSVLGAFAHPTEIAKHPSFPSREFAHDIEGEQAIF